jgi:hypothetical protein
MHFRVMAPILSVSLCLWTAIVRPPALGRRLDKCALLVVPCTQLARRLAVQMARGLFIPAEIAWSLVARLVSSCPIFLLLSGLLRGRGAKVVHVGYVRVLHGGRRRDCYGGMQ